MGLPTCSICGDALDTYKPGNFQWVEGWEKIRRSGEGGGHGLTFRKAHAKWACAECIRKQGEGIHKDQGGLF